MFILTQEDCCWARSHGHCRLLPLTHCSCDVWGFLRWLGVWREHPKASSSPATLGAPCCLAGPDPLDQGPYRVIIQQTCRWRSWQTLHLFQELNLEQFIRDLQMIEKSFFFRRQRWLCRKWGNEYSLASNQHGLFFLNARADLSIPNCLDA